MRPWEDDEDGPRFEDFGEQFNPERPFAFLQGVWRDEVRGSTMYVYPHSGRPCVAYCSGGDDELTGMYELWRFDGRQFVARWRWRRQPLAGSVVARARLRQPPRDRPVPVRTHVPLARPRRDAHGRPRLAVTSLLAPRVRAHERASATATRA